MISKYLSFKTKYRFLLFKQKFKRGNYFKQVKPDHSRKQAYVFLAADYGNLGDVAITYAQKKFLQDYSHFQVIEIPISQSIEGLWFVKKNIKKGDIVTTVGGGNMGDLYDQIAYIRQLTIQFFPYNRIISFPQTFDFSKTDKGQKSLQVAQKIYNKHEDFYIIAREQTSFELMKTYFPSAHILKTPDIVLSLNERNSSVGREGVVICMRKDDEKSLTNEQTEFVIKSAETHFQNVRFYDTHIGKDHLSEEERTLELKKIWDIFKKAELVITDRLHGMIFCHITGTPALVFQNNNHKVRETYDWIKENKSITLLKDFSRKEVSSLIEHYSVPESNLLDLQKDYLPLMQILL